MATPLHNPEIPGAKLKNWMKTGLGVLYTKEGIEPFVYDEIEQFQQKCLRDIRNINGLPADATCFSCCTENVVVCPTNRICNAGRGQCSFHRNSATQYLQSGCPKKICHNLKNEIQNAHRFYGPSYKTTDARQWCSNPWEVAKCFMPPDGYKDVTSAAETDFRGIISVIKNYKPFQPKVDDELSKRNNIFDKAIEVENAVRHSSHLGMEDEDVQQYLRILQDVLTYPGYLASNSTSQKLSQLENDTLLIDIEDIHKVLNNLAKAAENELRTEKDEDKRKAIKQKLEIIKVTNKSICEFGRHDKISLSKMEEKLQHAHDKVKEVGPSTKREVLQYHEDSDTVPSVMDLDRIARAIGINWELLGPHLGLTKTNIDHIKMDNDTSQKRIYQMLYIWREDQGPNGTKRNLFTAFKNQPSTSIDWETLGLSFPDAKKYKKKEECSELQAEDHAYTKRKKGIDCHKAGKGVIYKYDLETQGESLNEKHQLDDQGKYACQSQKQDSGKCDFKKVHDTTMSEEFVHGYSNALKSIGELVLPQGFGTIFRVGSWYGMTAAHVIAADEKATLESISSLLRDPSVYVKFQKEGEKFRLRRVVYTDFKLDIAVLEFVDNQALPPPLELFSHDIYNQIQEVVVIGSGHPTKAGTFLEPDVKVVKQDEIPELEIRNFLQQHGEDLKKKCDANGMSHTSFYDCYLGINEPYNLILNTFLGHGASGAPVVLKTSPEKVIGVFTCGYPRLFYELPSIRSSFPLKYTFEAATKTTWIGQSIYRFNPGTWSKLFRNSDLR